MSARAPSWLDAFQRRVRERLQATTLETGLLVRVSDASGPRWVAELPEPSGPTAPPPDRRPFRIASVTKVYVAAALHRLAEAGRLDLDASLARYVGAPTAEALSRAGYAVSAITLDQVMRHRAGLRDHCSSDPFLDRLRAEPGHRWTRAEQVAIAAGLGPPLAPPGEAFAYSDTGYVILGEVLERASGARLGEALAELLKLERLGLRRTTLDDGATAGLLPQDMDGVDALAFDPSFDLFGGGGLVSTLEEVDGFLRALFGGRVFDDPRTLAALFAAPPSGTDDPAWGHNGLMFRATLSGEDVWAHTGFWGVQAAFLPARRLALTAHFGRAPREGAYDKDALLEDFVEAVGGGGGRA